MTRAVLAQPPHRVAGLAANQAGLALALGLTILLPLFLLHVRVAAEAAFDLVAALFLVRSVAGRRLSWLRRPWVTAGLLWWGWTVLCTALEWSRDPAGGAGHLLQAALVLRFLVFAAALEGWVLGSARARSYLLASLSVATLYVAGQTALQFVTGHNLAGNPRWGDGELTGPFRGPRAAPTLVRILFPAMLPAMDALRRQPGRWGRVAAAAMLIAGVSVMVLIGQRMPVLLTALGLLATGLILPSLRGAAAAAMLAVCVLVGASAVISPPTFHRLVTKFSHQVETLPESPYGQIAGRALAIAGQNPWTGLGFNGFQAHCAEPRYQHGWHWPADPADDGGGAEMCTTHPHNLFLQALTDAGVPGLVLFAVLVALWCQRLSHRLWHQADPLRVGLFVAFVIQVWPLASTSPLVSLPIGGWFFLLLGFGLAAVPGPSPGSSTDE